MKTIPLAVNDPGYGDIYPYEMVNVEFVEHGVGEYTMYYNLRLIPWYRRLWRNLRALLH